ncbi:MAG: RNA polymerase sigma factor [Candidatus Riflebacteria bacterium]|nr:RNA polymerase sigma factor [Candidatus Riflebacteria bacterium]
MKSFPDDAKIVEQVRAGDKNSLELLIDRHLPGVLGFFGYLGAPRDIIDDLVQETFIRASRKLALYDSGRPFITWLLSIARNIFYDQCRKTAREKNLVDTLSEDKVTTAEENALIDCSIRELLDSLPDETKLLIELRVFQGLPFQEIAKILDEPEVNIRVRFHRTISRLRGSARKENNHGF